MRYQTTDAVARMRELVAAEVPFVHQGKDFAGIDCVGALAYAFQYTGVIPPYPRDPINGELERELNAIFEAPLAYRRNLLEPPFARSTFRELDVVSMQYRGPVRHVALIVNHVNIPGALSVIHTDSSRKKVVEHILDDRWLRRIIGVWRPAEDDAS